MNQSIANLKIMQIICAEQSNIYMNKRNYGHNDWQKFFLLWIWYVNDDYLKIKAYDGPCRVWKVLVRLTKQIDKYKSISCINKPFLSALCFSPKYVWLLKSARAGGTCVAMLFSLTTLLGIQSSSPDCKKDPSTFRET